VPLVPEKKRGSKMLLRQTKNGVQAPMGPGKGNLQKKLQKLDQFFLHEGLPTSTVDSSRK
jgi:hypothetical protein